MTVPDVTSYIHHVVLPSLLIFVITRRLALTWPGKDSGFSVYAVHLLIWLQFVAVLGFIVITYGWFNPLKKIFTKFLL